VSAQQLDLYTGPEGDPVLAWMFAVLAIMFGFLTLVLVRNAVQGRRHRRGHPDVIQRRADICLALFFFGVGVGVAGVTVELFRQVYDAGDGLHAVSNGLLFISAVAWPLSLGLFGLFCYQAEAVRRRDLFTQLAFWKELP
jgi:hypothetical protein